MVTITVTEFAEWRGAARTLLARGQTPDEVIWVAREAEQAVLPLGGGDTLPPPPDATSGWRPRIPRLFVTLAEAAASHRSPSRWDALYRLLWRIHREGAAVLELASDAEVRTVSDMAAQVRRDEHKMHAFVRFTPVTDAEGERYVAWYRPDHLVVRRAAPFFAERFSAMRWSILTPDLSAHWDLHQLSFTSGVPTPVAHASGDVEELWRVYYASVFNPARANLRATLREMPLRRWAQLPEAALIPSLLNSAPEVIEQVLRVRAPDTARPFVPDTTQLEDLRAAAQSCRGCRLYERATQAVFGEGRHDARVVLVGEQPGDAEDLQGRPFVGPAGQVLDDALRAAAIDRASVYLTNAVKHFSWEPRGKRRIHQTPRMSEMRACRPWLEAELQALRPEVVVCLGATAARSLLGPQARVGTLRGKVIEGQAWAPRMVVTVHPSAVLRSEERREEYFQMLVEDLKLIRRAANSGDQAMG